MAVNSPTGLLGVRSPIFITWDGTGTAASDIYYFKLEIYAWTGDKDVRPADPVYTINRTTGFVDSYPTADIAPFLENLFDQKTTNLDTDTFTTLSSDSLLWVEVDYDIEYLDDPFVVNDTGTTTRFLATDGYSDFVDGANKDIGRAILMEARDKYLYELDTYNMPIYLGDVGSSYETDAVKVKIVGDDATSDEVTITIGTGEDAEDRVLLFPVGIPNLQNYLYNEGLTSLTEPRTLDYYDVQILDSTDTVVDSRRFYVQCEPKYTPIQLQFINRYGMWESLTFFKASRQSVGVTKESYRQVVGSADSSGYDWNTYSRGARTYNHSITKRTTLNTGFVDEGMIDTIEDMLMSDYVLMTIDRTTYRVADTYVIGQDFRAVTIDTQSVAVQKHINDRTINYTLDVSFATPENARL